jgi:hypothetical protein
VRSLILVLILVSLNLHAAEEYFYSVPVEDMELEPFATFQLKANTKKLADGTLVLKYQLPEVLAGKNYFVVLTGANYSNAVFSLTGEKASAECQKVEKKSVCVIEHGDLIFDEKEVSKAIRRTSKSLKEISARAEVARHFKGDPVGILSF